MKTPYAILIGGAAGAAIFGLFVARHFAAVEAVRVADLAAQRATWAEERGRLEAALKTARSSRATIIEPAPATPQTTIVEKIKHDTPAEILARLKEIRIGAGQNRKAREAISEFEHLIAAGPAALPAIREFLARNEEVDYDLAGDPSGKSSRGGKMTTEFLLPPSLRLGLFEVARNIGGLDAEKVLTEVLASTGRGAEVAYLARALQEMAPGKYRDAAVAATRDLLSNPVNNGPGALDKNDRNYLLGVLIFFNDSSYAPQAQAQLVQADGNIDRSSLRYLQQTLGEQAVPIAAQAWQDSRIVPDQKEPLARIALNYVGANAQAEALFQTAINDPSLARDVRRNLIEDLNQDGFANPKKVTESDLPLIQRRLEFVQQNAPQAIDSANANAFDEVRKDLLDMQAKAMGQKKK